MQTKFVPLCDCLRCDVTCVTGAASFSAIGRHLDVSLRRRGGNSVLTLLSCLWSVVATRILTVCSCVDYFQLVINFYTVNEVSRTGEKRLCKPNNEIRHLFQSAFQPQLSHDLATPSVRFLRSMDPKPPKWKGRCYVNIYKTSYHSGVVERKDVEPPRKHQFIAT